MQKSGHAMEPAEIMAYLDGELPGNRAALAAAHLERCSECQALAGDLRTVQLGLLSWQVDPLAAPIAPVLHAAMAERASRPGWRERIALRPWMWVLISAGAVALVVGNLQLRQRQMASMALMDQMNRQEATPQAQAKLRYAKPDEQVFVLPSSAPMVARTAALKLTAAELDRARAAMDGILKRHNGYLGSLNISAPTGAPRSLIATLRVPAGDLAAALVDLRQLGRVDSEQQNSEEVTEQFIDLEGRLANARNTEQRLTVILRERTGKLSDVLDVEKELDRVRGEIEQMDGEKKGLIKRVDYATVDLTVMEAYQARLEMVPDSTWSRIRNASVEGYRNMVAGLVAVALFLAATLPTVLLWTALLFFPARYAWRKWHTPS
jgi:hypothetical protein